jgi:hypothetical protein
MGGACSSFATAAPVALGVRGSLWEGFWLSRNRDSPYIRTHRTPGVSSTSMYLACLSSV